MDRKVFYDAIRPHVNLTTQNVAGTEKVLDYAEARGTETNDLAYISATSWWETAQTMHPVKEAFWNSEDWRRKNLRYYPWYGRGLIQTTWEDNYRRMGSRIGVDLTENPDLLLEWKYALPALFIGMAEGLYTGKSLDDYIDGKDENDKEDLREFANARRIVNGTDRQVEIAKIALNFEHALRAAEYKPRPGAVPVVPDDLKPKPNDSYLEPLTVATADFVKAIAPSVGATPQDFVSGVQGAL